jgi:hypothetical protein
LLAKKGRKERALAAMLRLLPGDQVRREAVFDGVRRAAEASGELSEAMKHRLSRVEAILKGGAARPVEAIDQRERTNPMQRSLRSEQRPHASGSSAVGDRQVRGRSID